MTVVPLLRIPALAPPAGRRAALALCALVGLAGLVGHARPVAAEQWSNTSIAVDIAAISELRINGPQVVLSIEVAQAGEGLQPATDNRTSLSWSTNSPTAKKITAALDQDFSPGITLKVTLAQPTGSNGVTAGTQVLSARPVDVVTGIHGEAAAVALSYEARADVTVAPTRELRVVSYTLADG